MAKTPKKKIMTAREMNLALARVAAEIVERHVDRTPFALIGIRRRGVPLTERLKKQIENLAGISIDMGTLDITLYRDDLSTIAPNPVVEGSLIQFKVEDKIIILVDDVLYTGRTVRAALDSLIDYGRPKAVELAVLIDRGHRELPIQADFVGKYVDTADDEVIEVRLPEIDNEECVYLVTRQHLEAGATE